MKISTNSVLAVIKRDLDLTCIDLCCAMKAAGVKILKQGEIHVHIRLPFCLFSSFCFALSYGFSHVMSRQYRS